MDNVWMLVIGVVIALLGGAILGHHWVFMWVHDQAQIGTARMVHGAKVRFLFDTEYVWMLKQLEVRDREAEAARQREHEARNRWAVDRAALHKVREELKALRATLEDGVLPVADAQDSGFGLGVEAIIDSLPENVSIFPPVKKGLGQRLDAYEVHNPLTANPVRGEPVYR